jgi:hypothetical protein
MVVMDAVDMGSAAPANSPPRRWIPWTFGAGVFVLALLVGGVLVADWAWRNAEMAALLDRVEASEAVMGELQDAAEAAFEEHSAGGDGDKLDRELKQLAAMAEVDIAAAGLEVAALPIAIWHADIERARDAYLVHNQAWVEYMERASTSSAEFIAPQPLVNESFVGAAPFFLEAIPWPDGQGFAARVAEVFAIPEDMYADQVSS